MFLLVPAYPDCPGSKAVKWSLLLLLLLHKVNMFLGHVACAECKDVALCYRYRLASPSLSVVVSPTKTAEPIKMPFGLWTQVPVL